MQTTDPYSSRVTATVGQPDMPAQPLTLLADLLTAPTVSEPRRSDWSWPPRHTARFIGECDQRLLVSAVEELGTNVQGGDWLPFEQALTKRLDLLQNELSKTMLTSLARAPQDSAHISIMHGGYQIHLDTFTCFWQGHPETASNLEEMIGSLCASNTPFTDVELNLLVAKTLRNSIATGTLDLPHFVYEHLHPEFVTLSCHPSLKAEATRRVALQQSHRGRRQ